MKEWARVRGCEKVTNGVMISMRRVVKENQHVHVEEACPVINYPCLHIHAQTNMQVINDYLAYAQLLNRSHSTSRHFRGLWTGCSGIHAVWGNFRVDLSCVFAVMEGKTATLNSSFQISTCCTTINLWCMSRKH